MATKVLTTQEPIPGETALRICAGIRQLYQGKWWTLAGMQCAFCVYFSKGDPAKMCVSSRPDFRGCTLVSARYEHSETEN